MHKNRYDLINVSLLISAPGGPDPSHAPNQKGLTAKWGSRRVDPESTPFEISPHRVEDHPSRPAVPVVISSPQIHSLIKLG
jgi:hypothetical protein